MNRCEQLSFPPSFPSFFPFIFSLHCFALHLLRPSSVFFLFGFSSRQLASACRSHVAFEGLGAIAPILSLLFSFTRPAPVYQPRHSDAADAAVEAARFLHSFCSFIQHCLNRIHNWNILSVLLHHHCMILFLMAQATTQCLLFFFTVHHMKKNGELEPHCFSRASLRQKRQVGFDSTLGESGLDWTASSLPQSSSLSVPPSPPFSPPPLPGCTIDVRVMKTDDRSLGFKKTERRPGWRFCP